MQKIIKSGKIEPKEVKIVLDNLVHFSDRNDKMTSGSGEPIMDPSIQYPKERRMSIKTCKFVFLFV